MKVLFITNLPSPYRIDFFNEFGKYCDLTVLYERHSALDRNENWKGDAANNYSEKYVDLKPIGTDSSIGFGLVNEIKVRSFDFLIISGYASPAVVMAIVYCRIKNLPYYVESDGGFNKKDKFPKSIIKRYLLRKATGHFISCDEYKKYLMQLGIDESRLYKYPFTSLKEEDIVSEPISSVVKQQIRSKLNITEKRVVLAVGQFIQRKGFDVLINAAKDLPAYAGIYIVGGNPTDEYIAMQAKLKLNNIHYMGFKSKEELKEYYQASDIFVLPTRKDIWGLVVNEAMANGLPVITTNKCIAGLELINNGKNGFIVEADNIIQLSNCINEIIDSNERLQSMCVNSINTISNYTIEKMVKCHLQVLLK